MTRLLIILSMLIIPIFTLQSSVSAAARNEPTVHIVVKASRDAGYVTRAAIRSKDWLKWLERPASVHEANWLPITDALLTVHRSGQLATYLIDESGYLYELSGGRQLRPPDAMRQELIRQVRQLRSEHYGIMLPWSDMQTLFPRQDIFTVMDLETGRSFRVQRRAGSSHADVQPLTREDTRVMKQIYNGRWSWKRRAILVWHPLDSLNGQTYAASMHGMPHGGDGIPDNAFAGHFCIHFLHSKTHGSGREDFDHHLMIYKAAGKLMEFYAAASPEALVHSFFSALNQQDDVLLSGCFTAANHPHLTFFKQEMARIASAHFEQNMRTNTEAGKQELVREITVQAELYRRHEGRVRQQFTFMVTREALHMPWKITQITLVS